jgi:methionyl-tRNA formyltransferase
MNVVLCGYNWAGCRALDKLLELGCNVFVCTHESPDYIPSLYNYCIELGVPVTLDSVNKTIFPFIPEYLCSIYYRNIIRKPVLEYVNFRAMNLHPSLLPKYRGCSSLTWAMIEQESETGFTYHYIDESCDTGKIILQKKLPIFKFENQNNIYQRAMFEALANFEEAFELLCKGYEGKEQIGEPSYFCRGAPEGGEIKDGWSESKVKAFINAMISPPLPYATYKGCEVKSFQEYLQVRIENRD